MRDERAPGPPFSCEAVYRTCLFCIGQLGTNDVLEDHPVGRTIAFDPVRGRLWVVCPECNRWNLTPIEERWEAIDSAERHFRDCRRVVARENIGICIVADGTLLIRVGEVLPAEYASWRYGRQLRARAAGHGVYRRLVEWLSSITTGTIFAPGVFDRFAVIHRETSGEGEAAIRRQDLDGAEIELGDTGMLRLRLIRPVTGVTPVIEGETARVLLERMLLNVNRESAPDRLLASAVQFLDRHPDGEELFTSLGEGQGPPGRGRLRLHYEGEGQWRGEWANAGVRGFQPVPRYRTVALEMVMHEAVERRALEGELRELLSRWKEAEAIARIADSLT